MPLTRNVGNIVMDVNDVETVQLKTQGGVDNVTVNDLTGTDVKLVAIDLAATGGTAADGQFDGVTVDGSSGKDAINIALVGSTVSVTGLSAQVTIDHADADRVAPRERLRAATTASTPARSRPAPSTVLDGGAGNDTLTGSLGVDFLLGGEGNFVIGGRGDDVALLGAGNDTFRWHRATATTWWEGAGRHRHPRLRRRQRQRERRHLRQRRAGALHP